MSDARPSTPRLTTAVIYARSATTSMLERDVEEQIEECYRCAHQHGATVIAEYADCGASGTTLGRLGIQALLGRVATDPVDLVVCTSLGRIARSRQPLLEALGILECNGVGVALTRPAGLLSEPASFALRVFSQDGAES